MQAGACVECGHVFARYYCEVCRLWDESGAPTYHCPYCNVCRRGHGLGLDYHHCMLCNMCVSLDRLTTHQCDESSAASLEASERFQVFFPSFFSSDNLLTQCVPQVRCRM